MLTDTEVGLTRTSLGVSSSIATGGVCRTRGRRCDVSGPGLHDRKTDLASGLDVPLRVVVGCRSSGGVKVELVLMPRLTKLLHPARLHRIAKAARYIRKRDRGCLVFMFFPPHASFPSLGGLCDGVTAGATP